MNYKKKNIFLLTGVILMLFLVYKVTVSRTLDLRLDLKGLMADRAKSIEVLNTGGSLVSREQYADSILKKHSVNNVSVQNNLLEFLNEQCAGGNLQISDFLAPHRVDDEGSHLISYRFRLQGSYKAIENLLYQLEQQKNFGQLIHIAWEKKFDYRKRKNFLQCFVIVQSYETILTTGVIGQ